MRKSQSSDGCGRGAQVKLQPLAASNESWLGQPMKGAEILIKALECEGVDLVFGYPGGAIMPVYDALLNSSLKHILVRHEQGAALAADGYARVTGKVGVCMATSGPGATNLITGLANSFMDSVPVVAITGQVGTSFMGTDAFQEVDIFGISMSVVKHSFIVRNATEIPKIVHDAFEIANTGRPGPVLIDFPKDVANAQVDNVKFFEISNHLPEHPEENSLANAREIIAKSAKPLVYAGGGTRIARASKEIRDFVEATGIPAVTTLQGLGCIPGDHPLFLGMLGMHGSKNANMAVQECDLLIAVGVRFDDRVTGKLAEFAPHAKVIHMDIDPAEIGKLRQVQCALQGDIKSALRRLHVKANIGPWVEKCLANKKTHAWRYDAPTTKVYAPKFIKELTDRTPKETFVACDVGQHQMWVAQHYRFNSPHMHLTSGGLGTMGFGLPAAIGAQLACPEALVVNVTGDGSIMINIQELATVKRYGLPVKIIVFDNQALGMVRQWQELFFDGRYSEVSLHDNPDFVRLAEAFDIPGIAVKEDSEIIPAIEKLLSEKGPLLVHVLINPEENVWPLVPPGKSNSQMMEAKDDAVCA
jgi:acetolactate synthase-1/2/3 large subunit